MKYDRVARSMVPTLPAGEERCPACGSLLQAEAVQNEIPQFSVGTFGGKTDEEKKAILKQRYDAGMKTGGKDEVEMRRRTAIAKMIGYDK